MCAGAKKSQPLAGRRGGKGGEKTRGGRTTATLFLARKQKNPRTAARSRAALLTRTASATGAGAGKNSSHGCAVRFRSPPTTRGGFNCRTRFALPRFRAVIQLLFCQGRASRGGRPRQRAFLPCGVGLRSRVKPVRRTANRSHTTHNIQNSPQGWCGENLTRTAVPCGSALLRRQEEGLIAALVLLCLASAR